MKNENQNWSGKYEKSYSGSSYNKEERSHDTGRKVESKPSEAPRREVPPRQQSTQSSQGQQSPLNPQSPENSPTQEKKSRLTWKHFIMIWLFFTIMWNGINWLMNIGSSDVDEQPEETIDYPWTHDEEDSEEDIEAVPIDDVVEDETEDASVSESSTNAPTDNNEIESEDDLSSLEILERRNHAEVVKAAKRAGVSTEGTTEEILDRINHANVVKQAKRVGVSTEGTTEEILNRIIEKQLESIR